MHLDWGLVLGILIGDWDWRLGIRIWGLGFRIGIEIGIKNRDWDSGIGIGD